MCHVTNRKVAELSRVVAEMGENGELEGSAYASSWEHYEETGNQSLKEWVESATEELGEHGIRELIVGLENILGYVASLSQLQREPRSLSDG